MTFTSTLLHNSQGNIHQCLPNAFILRLLTFYFTLPTTSSTCFVPFSRLGLMFTFMKRIRNHLYAVRAYPFSAYEEDIFMKIIKFGSDSFSVKFHNSHIWWNGYRWHQSWGHWDIRVLCLHVQTLTLRTHLSLNIFATIGWIHMGVYAFAFG